MSNRNELVSTLKQRSLSPKLSEADKAVELIELKDVQQCIAPAMQGRRLDLAGGAWEILVLLAVEEAMKAQPQRSIRPQLLKECLRNAYEAVNTMPETTAVKIRKGSREKFVTVGESWLLRSDAKRSLSSVIERAYAKCLERGFLTLVGGFVEIATAGRTALTAARAAEPSTDPIESLTSPRQEASTEKRVREETTLEQPKSILHGYKDILAALHIQFTKDQRERVKYANQTQDGPIIVGKRGEKPRVDRRLLVKWWNSLADKIDAAAATSETAIETPKGDVLWDGNKRIGHVKESQCPTGRLARHDATSRNIRKRQKTS